MAADLIAFVHQKGGTGKSTLAITSAQCLARRGRAVLILDVDYQGTASAWGEQFAEVFNASVDGGVEVRSLVQDDITSSLARFAASFDVIVVDAPPTLSELSGNILRAVERVFVPTRLAWPDVWALATVAGLAEAVTTSVRVVFNQVEEDMDMTPFVEYMDQFGLLSAGVTLPRHADFTAVFVDGIAGPVALDHVSRMLDTP